MTIKIARRLNFFTGFMLILISDKETNIFNLKEDFVI